MKAIVLILAVLMAIIIMAFLATFAAITIRMQEQDDKLTDIELRLDNMAEAGRMQESEIRELQRITNTKH